MLERIKAGTAAGLAAGLAVAVMVLVYDLVLLEPLATPRLLAGSILGTSVEISSGLGVLAWVTAALHAAWGLAAYTAAHFTVFALVGIGAAYVFHLGLFPGNVLTGAVYGGLVGTAVFYLGLTFVAPEFIAAPDWRLVLLTNGLAGIVIVSQLVVPAEESGAESAA